MRNIAIIIVAALFAGIIAFVVNVNVSSKKEVVQAPVDVVNVLVAKMDIPSGTFVTPDVHIGWQPIKKENIQTGYILEGSVSLQEYVGAVARNRIMAGEPVTSDKLVKTEDGGFMAAVLKPGMRAITVALTPITANAGFIFPGDRVDVVLSRPALQGVSSSVSDVIIKSARVLALDQRYTNAGPTVEVAKTATLEVTPEEANDLALASESGKISLSLVSSSNRQQSDSDEYGDEPEDLYTEKEEEASFKPYSVKIQKGSEQVVNREFMLKRE